VQAAGDSVQFCLHIGRPTGISKLGWFYVAVIDLVNGGSLGELVFLLGLSSVRKHLRSKG